MKEPLSFDDLEALISVKRNTKLSKNIAGGNMGNMQSFIDEMNNWGWSINARISFNRFMDAIKTEKEMTEEIQKFSPLLMILY